jgi:hypothetical protein
MASKEVQVNVADADRHREEVLEAVHGQPPDDFRQG